MAKLLEARGAEVAHLIIMDSYRISEEFEFGEAQLAEFKKGIKRTFIQAYWLGHSGR